MAMQPFINISESSAVFKDGTIMKQENLQKDYIDDLRNILSGNSVSTPIGKHLEKAFKKMTRNTEESGLRTLNYIAKAVKEIGEYKSEVDEDYARYKIYRTLFPWQKGVYDSISNKTTMLCGRRSGKSYLEAALAVLHCFQGYDTINGYMKKRMVMVMGLTIQKAADVFWQNILNYCSLSGLQYKVDNSSYSIYFSNGAEIHLFGNSSKAEREKLRGLEFSLIIIDECQSQQALAYLYTDILGPIIKGRGSETVLSGTGALTNKGFWKSITEDPSWTHFTATMKDNPTIPATALAEVLEENGWDENNITYQREYLAYNVIDTTRLVYPSYKIGKHEGKIPVFVAVGVDYGWADSNAFVPVVLYKDGSMQELNSVKFNKSSVTDIVNQAKSLYSHLLDELKIDKKLIMFVADTSDQSISREVQIQGIPISNAYKVDRIQQIKDLRQDLGSGKVLVSSDCVVDELDNYVWKYNDETHEVVYETDDDYYHPDSLAALRYAYYYLKHRR